MAATAHQNTRAPTTKPQQQKTAKMHLHFDCIKMKSINLTSGYALTPKQGLNPGRVEDFNVDIKFYFRDVKLDLAKNILHKIHVCECLG